MSRPMTSAGGPVPEPSQGRNARQQPAVTRRYAETRRRIKTNEMGVPTEIAPLRRGANSKVSSTEDSLSSEPGSDTKARPSRPLEVPEDMLAASLNTSPPSVSSDFTTGDLAEDLAIARGDFSAASDLEDNREAIVMVEVKRLMGRSGPRRRGCDPRGRAKKNFSHASARRQ